MPDLLLLLKQCKLSFFSQIILLYFEQGNVHVCMSRACLAQLSLKTIVYLTGKHCHKLLLVLANQSWKLQWAFLITFCPLSVVVVVIVNISHFHLLQNHRANFNQTWHKASLGDGDSSLFKWRATPFPRGDNYEIAKIHWQN